MNTAKEAAKMSRMLPRPEPLETTTSTRRCMSQAVTRFTPVSSSIQTTDTMSAGRFPRKKQPSSSRLSALLRLLESMAHNPPDIVHSL